MNEEKSKREMLIESILQNKNNKFTRENIEKILEDKEKKVLEVVLRQTNLEETQAKKLLEENDYDPITVIKKHFGIKPKQDEKKISINQGVFKGIREMMDDASKKYRLSKELEKYKEEVLSTLKNKNLESITE
tara:strand:+ start:644 stop:1042 length:399 start_codon:yes stop_codon:yes gene_type:complete